jgi:hypothetical protein
MAHEYPDREYQSARRRLPGTGDDDGTAYELASRYAPAWRDSGMRRTRRAANWTAAALVAGVAATSGYFVHAAANPSVSSTNPTPGVTQLQTVTGHGHKPSLTHAVATSSGSGVTAGSSGSGRSGGGGPTTWRDN